MLSSNGNSSAIKSGLEGYPSMKAASRAILGFAIDFGGVLQKNRMARASETGLDPMSQEAKYSLRGHQSHEANSGCGHTFREVLGSAQLASSTALP